MKQVVTKRGENQAIILMRDVLEMSCPVGSNTALDQVPLDGVRKRASSKKAFEARTASVFDSPLCALEVRGNYLFGDLMPLPREPVSIVPEIGPESTRGIFSCPFFCGTKVTGRLPNAMSEGSAACRILSQGLNLVTANSSSRCRMSTPLPRRK